MLYDRSSSITGRRIILTLDLTLPRRHQGARVGLGASTSQAQFGASVPGCWSHGGNGAVCCSAPGSAPKAISRSTQPLPTRSIKFPYQFIRCTTISDALESVRFQWYRLLAWRDLFSNEIVCILL